MQYRVLFFALFLGLFSTVHGYYANNNYANYQNNCCPEQVCDCYCLCCKWEPRYYCKQRCYEVQETRQYKQCRYVPKYYQKCCCRMVPQYYNITCCKYVPETYYTTCCQSCPRYCQETCCDWVPCYYYKHCPPKQCR